MKRITFLGFAINKDDVHLGVHVSGNRMQNGLIEALLEFYGTNLSVLSVYPVASFPKDKRIYIKSGVFKLDCGASAKRIGFINLFVLKQISQAFNVYKSLISVIRKEKSDTIICFNPYWIFAVPLFLIPSKRIKRVCIIADIPVTIPLNYGAIKRAFRKYEIKSYYKTIKKFDGLVVLNKEVLNEFAPDLPYVVMDGGIAEDEILLPPLSECDHKWNQIVFTGALEPYNCIKEIIDAFLEADVENSNLVICGNGSLSNYVKTIASQNCSVDYHGIVTNDEAKDLQRKSGLLMNIRRPDQFAMRLTFPSKVIEYMLSGTPVLTTHINGLGEEYLDHMYTTEATVSDIAHAIKEICSLPVEDRAQKGIAAREFIVRNKTYRKHCEKIIPFIEGMSLGGE